MGPRPQNGKRAFSSSQVAQFEPRRALRWIAAHLLALQLRKAKGETKHINTLVRTVYAFARLAQDTLSVLPGASLNSSSASRATPACSVLSNSTKPCAPGGVRLGRAGKSCTDLKPGYLPQPRREEGKPSVSDPRCLLSDRKTRITHCWNRTPSMSSETSAGCRGMSMTAKASSDMGRGSIAAQQAGNPTTLTYQICAVQHWIGVLTCSRLRWTHWRCRCSRLGHWHRPWRWASRVRIFLHWC